MSEADNDPVLQIKLTSVRQYEASLAEAEARGYARGIKDRALAISEQGARADAVGYARGVEDAAKIAAEDWLDVDVLVSQILALLGPKGEAK